MAEVARKVGASFESGGEQVLKNIKQPVQVYFWHPDKPKSSAAGASASASAGRKPSLALLSLEPLAADEQTRTLAVGVNEAIASSLANLTGIELLTAVEAANYHALGSVQTSGPRYRVTVKLVDRRANKQFWSERFDGNMATNFDTLDELALRICSAIRYEIYERETERSRVRSIDEQTNEQLMGQAGHILLNSKRADYERSVGLIDVVLGRDPENFMALAIRAWGSMVEVVCGYREVSPTDMKTALKLSRKAIELNKRSDFANLVHGLVILYVERDLDGAVRQAKRSLELNPTYALAIDMMGLAAIFAGDAESGIPFCQRALHANSRFPANNWFMDDLALGAFVRQDYSAAVDWARRSEQIHSDVPRPLLLQISSHFNAGELSKAQIEVERLLSTCPEFRVHEVRRWPFLKQEHWNRFVGGLVGAGLPE
jgi:TolB-like protein